MATSEVKRLSKIIAGIAKENGETYSAVHIELTHNTYAKGDVLIYKAYINSLVPWLESDSFNGLIAVALNHIRDKKENARREPAPVIIDQGFSEVDDLPF